MAEPSWQLHSTWDKLKYRLRTVAEGRAGWAPEELATDSELIQLGLVDEGGSLTSDGHAYYMAEHVTQNGNAATTALRQALQKHPVVNAFCEHLWAAGDVPVDGAVSLLVRVTRSGNYLSAKRWLTLMNAGKVVAYNRNKPTMRVSYNPTELLPPQEDAEREKTRPHVLSPETPYSNLFAIRELLRSSRKYIRWYEPHLPAKVLEVLVKEVKGNEVSELRLLSGPANIDAATKDDFKRFKKEMADTRSINAEWRVLPNKEAFKHHDRFFITEGMARNLPPLNSILAGSTAEILPSNITVAEFDEWWSRGGDLKDFQLPEATKAGQP